MKKPPPGKSDTPDSRSAAMANAHGHGSLAGKILKVFRVGGDSEQSVGRHGHASAAPAAKTEGPVQTQAHNDATGPLLARTIADGAYSAASRATLSDSTLQAPQGGLASAATIAAMPAPTLAASPAAVEPIRLQTFSIDLAERLARTRAAQQDVLRELDKFDETGEDLGKTVHRQR